ncbi:LTA synthase family protein [Arcanobacterium hippocoleae]
MNLEFPKEKRNLIHIYLESMENSYYSKDEGGYLAESLMPDLAELTHEGVSFSDTTNFGGPQQVPGTEHSVAAMVAMGAGSPMLSAGHRNGQRLSYPDFATTGDLLAKAGYQNVFMLGSDGNWGGLADYYRRHGNFEIYDLQTAYDTGFVEDGYKVRWGLEDEKLYEAAKLKLSKLAAGKQPFYFILENADTHFPDGYYSPKHTNPPYTVPYSNAIYYSQQDTVALVRWIQAQPWAKNTTIVLTGDHQSMERNYFENWDPNYNRTVVNVFLNPVQGNKIDAKLTQNRIYAPYDFFPTILAAIGVKIDGERLGMGTNLFPIKKR